jgi:hypothetical protein
MRDFHALDPTPFYTEQQICAATKPAWYRVCTANPNFFSPLASTLASQHLRHPVTLDELPFTIPPSPFVSLRPAFAGSWSTPNFFKLARRQPAE